MYDDYSKDDPRHTSSPDLSYEAQPKPRKKRAHEQALRDGRKITEDDAVARKTPDPGKASTFYCQDLFL